MQDTKVKIVPCGYKKTKPEKWKQTSEGAPCLSCGRSFITVPCFIPVFWDTHRNVICLTGNYCTWNCAKSDMIKKRIKSCSLLGMMSLLISHKNLYKKGSTMTINPNKKDYPILDYSWVQNLKWSMNYVDEEKNKDHEIKIDIEDIPFVLDMTCHINDITKFF